MVTESLIHDFRYALRGIRRSPLFAVGVAATIGIGLGLFGSAFTILNAYVLKPIELPNPHELYAVSWDTESTRRQRFRLTDFESLRDSQPHFASLAAMQEATVMDHGEPVAGLLVSGDYFQLLGARAAMGRLLGPSDATAPGAAPVVVLSHHTWQSRYGSDPAIVGKQISLGARRFEVVGVRLAGFNLLGEELISFWAPLTMAGAFASNDPWTDPNVASLSVLGRLRSDVTESQATAWLDIWLKNRFPAGSASAPIAVNVESRATRFPWNRVTMALFWLMLSSVALVLLVACANVTNLVLARALGRQQEIALRLSLGASRFRIIRQLLVESLVLAVPASALGLAATMVTARVFPALIIGTFPEGVVRVEALMAPLDPDVRVMSVLFAAAVVSAVLISLVPASRLTRIGLVRASRGEASLDARRSRLRSGLVALQMGACVLFLAGAAGLVNETKRLAALDLGLSYERVSHVWMEPRLRAAVADRLASDPAVEGIAAAWQPPLDNSLPQIPMRTSDTQLTQPVGYMVVSPEYFPLLDIRIARGRAFTADEGDQGAPVALVSEATARRLWPGRDPVGQTLELLPSSARDSQRRPAHTAVQVIGVTEDVVSGDLMEGVDATCVYFATSLRTADQAAMIVRSRVDGPAVRAAVAAAVNAIELNATFGLEPMRTVVGGVSWVFQMLSAAASLLGVVGLVLAFSGTYAVVSFLVTQRRREFGVRMALGATVGRIVSGMLVETFRIALLGVAVGLVVAVAGSRVVSGAIPFIPTFGFAPYLVGTGIVVLSTAVAALLPSWRTAHIDPSTALRLE